MKIRLLVILFFTCCLQVKAQFTPEHISNRAVYDFLDEMAGQGNIQINSAIKPYSKEFIAEKLREAGLLKQKLNIRQQRELAFYLSACRLQSSADTVLKWQEPLNIFKKYKHLATSHNPFGLHYKDNLFTFSIRPVYGLHYMTNQNGSVTHTYGGLEAYSTIDSHWSIYASLRDNHQNQLLARPSYFTLDPGGAFKENEGGRKGGDFSEMRAGITYAWKWGDIGLVKDHIVWGNNNHGSNIFSGRTPSFAHIRLHLHPAKWIDFNYIHGWLASEVVDSAKMYVNVDRKRWSYRPKFMAANMLTVIPFKNLYLSAGNSIIYSDLGGVHPAYLIPLAFYKSIDHTLNHAIDNQNSQMFFDISSRQIRHLHAFMSVFIDEFSVTRLKDKNDHNFIGWKGGFDLSDFPLQNVILKAEYTRTTPITYKHYVSTLTFESNKYNLGHYLRDNSEELYFSLTFIPLARLHTSLSYTSLRHGGEYSYNHSAGLTTLPFLTYDTFTGSIAELTVQYQPFSNVYLDAAFRRSSIKGYDIDGHTAQYYLDMFSPAFYQGATDTFTIGFSIGF